MTQEKFTPAPWVVENVYGDNVIKVADTKKHQGKLIGTSRLIDNAHLIAAAPDMYTEIERDVLELKKEIKSIKRQLPNSGYICELEIKIEHKENILAKARGKL